VVEGEVALDERSTQPILLELAPTPCSGEESALVVMPFQLDEDGSGQFRLDEDQRA
jgi:hypothetical protein